jgi:putative copper export protein
MELFFHCLPLWLELTALAFCLGGIPFLFWFSSAPEHNAVPGGGGAGTRLWLYFGTSLAVMLASTLVDLLSRTAEMSGEPFMSAFTEVPTVLLKTHAGTVWLIRAACLVLSGLLIVIGRRQQRSRAVLILLALLCAAMSFTESASGHAADKGDFTVSEFVDWLHLLASSVWAGGLFVLSLLVLPGLRPAGGASVDHFVGSLITRFSRLAGLSAFIVVMTASYNAWQYVGSLTAAVRTIYGLTVTVKVALLFLLLLLAAFHRYAMVPWFDGLAGTKSANAGFLSRLAGNILAWISPNGSTRRVLTVFRGSLRLEAILMICLLFCAALLRHEIPAKHALHHRGGETQMPHHQH